MGFLTCIWASVVGWRWYHRLVELTAAVMRFIMMPAACALCHQWSGHCARSRAVAMIPGQICSMLRPVVDVRVAAERAGQVLTELGPFRVWRMSLVRRGSDLQITFGRPGV